LDAVPIVAVCVLAAILRALTLGVQSFDFDESYTVGTVLNGSFGHALHMIPVTESSPPLYYVVAWLWTRLFGLGEVGIRSLSALLGTALVLVVYLIATRLGSRRAGLIAGLLVAVNPFFVWYSQEARTYALVAVLSALSLWAFLGAIDQPGRRTLTVWAMASSAAILSHYFAVFLVAPEAVWLILRVRQSAALVASAAVTLVGVAQIPLLVAQADNRTQWIEELSLWSRIKEVAKKWITGEIAPTRNWQLALVALLVGSALVAAVRRLTSTERRRIVPVLTMGVLAVAIPLVLDVGGLHYLISKNVMPAAVVLTVAGALTLGADRARLAGFLGTGIAATFFLAISVEGAVDPALQRPDYRAATRALGPPVPDQAVVSPNLGNAPVALFRPGAVPMPAAGALVREVIVIDPVPRADVSSTRQPTPAPPPGFRFVGRKDARTYTIICFVSPAAQTVHSGVLRSLVGGGSGVTAQIWPGARSVSSRKRSAVSSSPC
jgi:4-amino-4-deoxy-L-arabinose transferase-like glycosyltransferase